jgi:hypothetical protein
MSDTKQPYGIHELEQAVITRGDRVKCVVRGCWQWLKRPTRKSASGEPCPDHGVIVHSNTFRYADPADNLIVAAEYFCEHIQAHPFKFDKNRFGHEASEDAVTWNVFMSLREARLLCRVVELVTGSVASEPQLMLWGLCIEDHGVEPWPLLIDARQRFESDLPVKRPLTEPDIALWAPGEYLILIEAKLTSPNSTYKRDTTGKLFDLTIDQVVSIYRDPQLQMLDDARASRRNVLHHQLWRNAVLGEWMARQDSPSTKAYLANLVREGYGDETCEEFLTLVRPEHQDRFELITWEQVYGIAAGHRPACDRLCAYMDQKTEHLRRAFRVQTKPLGPGTASDYQ